MKNFNWIDIFKRFITCFVILVGANMAVWYYRYNNFNIPQAKYTKYFIFALVYSLFSSYLSEKSKNDQQSL
jgi:predicted tellurium resistance membrane protein TerC